MLCCRIVNGIKNKNIKNSLGARHGILRILRCDCALCVIGNEFPCRQPHNLSPPSYEGLPLCPKDKNHSPFHGEKPLTIKWILERRLHQISQKRFCMVGTRYFASASNDWYSIWYHCYGRTWSITSLPGLVFRRRRSTRWKHVEGMSLRYNRTYFRGNKSFLSSIWGSSFSLSSA